jgi:hypothetical protein
LEPAVPRGSGPLGSIPCYCDVTDGNGSSREISAPRSSFGGFEQCDLEPQVNF